MIFRSVLWLIVLIFTYDKKATTFLNAAAMHRIIQYACLPHTTFMNDHEPDKIKRLQDAIILSRHENPLSS